MIISVGGARLIATFLMESGRTQMPVFPIDRRGWKPRLPGACFSRRHRRQDCEGRWKPRLRGSCCVHPMSLVGITNLAYGKAPLHKSVQ